MSCTQTPFIAVVLKNGGGSGTFTDPVSYVVGRRPQDLAVGDIDRDGDLDVFVTLLAAQRVTDLLNPEGV